ncbi:hypothetical protein K2X83_01465 [Patescibacteria group bacterium]|nr:hypothetical protein [Patescibacteria group bacterium]
MKEVRPTEPIPPAHISVAQALGSVTAESQPKKVMPPTEKTPEQRVEPMRLRVFGDPHCHDMGELYRD